MLRDMSRVDCKRLHSAGESKFKSKSNGGLSQSYSLSTGNLQSSQVKKLSNINVSVTEHLLSSSYISSLSLASTYNHQPSTHLGISNPENE